MMDESRGKRILAMAIANISKEDSDYEYHDGYDSDRDPEYILSPEPHPSSTSELENEPGHDLEEHSTSKGRPKKGRKRKYLNMTRSKNIRAKNRGECYFNYKGKTINKKDFDETFRCECVRKCYTIITNEERRKQFEKYWELGSYDAQTAFIGVLVREEPKKRKYGQGISSRQFSRHYLLNNTGVCRETFIKTLGISTKRVNTALQKLRTSSITDKRGKQQGGKNKIEDERKQVVMKQIDIIPKYKSHYRREQTFDAKFLPPDLTLLLMYKKYTEEVEKPVSFVTYRRIFLSEFNLRFKSLKKDTCNTCDTLQAHIQNATSVEERQKITEEHDVHINAWQRAREKMKEDLNKAKEIDWIECLTFDLEKTLPLPRLPTGILFYKRQIWLYNLGVHSGSNNKADFYVWLENEAGRGAQEIGSCLNKHIIEKVGPDVKELILWSDSCGGQNRNIKMTIMMKTVLESHPSLEKIFMRFLVSGHSFLLNDSDFSDIECALKHQQRLYLPDDYIRVMKECRKKNKFRVTRMKSTDFYSTAEVEKKLICNRKVGVNKEKKSFEDESYAEIDIRKKQAGRPTEKSFKDFLTCMWAHGKKISIPKLQDIKSIMHLIPLDCQDFYKNLQGEEGLEDDVDGFTGPPDFEVEEN